MLSKTAAALEKAGWLAENLVVNATKMQRNVAESNGMMLAEAVTFALAKTMPRVDAVRIVQRAIQIAIDNKQHLVDAVKIQVKIALDWETLRTEHNHLGVAHAQIDQVLNAVKNYQ
ncbi:hypothetical protein KFU94_21315 [Chloroflexi bacterium TSY]|nr:hypothetical protein [Chloroflexi bacterium TSY]